MLKKIFLGGWARVLPESYFYIQIFSLFFIFTLFHFFTFFTFSDFFTFLHFYNFQILSLFTFLHFYNFSEVTLVGVFFLYGEMLKKNFFRGVGWTRSSTILLFLQLSNITNKLSKKITS